MKVFLLIILVSLISSNLILIQQNHILNNLTKEEFYCIKNSIIFLFIIIYVILINNGNIYKKIKTIDNKKWKYIMLDVLLTIINILLWYYLLQNADAHKLISNINPLTILITLLLSFFFYKKNVTRNECFGIIIVLIGIFIINKK